MARKIKLVLLTCVLFTFCGTGSFGQKITTKLADKRFNEFAYVEAIKLYEFAYQKDTSDNYLLKQLAEANRSIGNNPQLEKWLKKIIDRHQEQPEDVYHYFQALKSNGKYESAQYWLDKYTALISKSNPEDKTNSFLTDIDKLKNDSLDYEIFNVSLNTSGSELGPVIYNNRVVFSSTSLQGKASIHYKWNELPFLHMYSAKIDTLTGDLINPEPFAPRLRTPYHDGPVTFDRKNREMYYTSNNVVKGKAAKSTDGVVNLKIFMGKNTNEDWKQYGEFKYNSKEYSVGHPSINKDGTILYFASDMPGGYGRSDIYCCVRRNGRWDTPNNLGPDINTAGNELFPFISYEDVLYFASDRTEGLGGMDIYYSVPVNGVFGKCKNMGYPVNSSSDDFGLTLDSIAQSGYFCSNRPGGKGNDDLFHLKIKRDSLIIKGTVKEKNTNNLIANASVCLMSLNGLCFENKITNNNGQFEFKLRKTQQYLLKVNKVGYDLAIIQPTTVFSYSDKTVEQEIYLEQKIILKQDFSNLPITFERDEGPVQIVEFQPINYNLDQSSIRWDAAVILDKLIVYLKENPDMRIKIESHTDSRADDVYNLILSRKRAVAAFDYIVSKGIDADRISYYGFGETRLLNNCGNGVFCDEKRHEENRRSIVKVFRKVNEGEKL